MFVLVVAPDIKLGRDLEMGRGRRGGANFVDLHVGSRLRLRRRGLGVSQQKLADRLGVTFQHIQKYERGANRISASTLYELACALEIDVGYFYEGIPSPATGGGSMAAAETFDQFLAQPGAMSLAKAFLTIESPRVQRLVADLVRDLGQAQEAAQDAAPSNGAGTAG